MGVPWQCSHCGVDVASNFQICWKCQRPRDPSLDAPAPAPATEEDAPRRTRGTFVALFLIGMTAFTLVSAVWNYQAGVGAAIFACLIAAWAMR